LTTGDYASPPTSFPSANLAPCQHAYTVAGCHVITPDHQGGTDVKEDEEVPLILGRPFMKTARIIVDIYKGDFQVRIQDEEVTLNLFMVLKILRQGKSVYKRMQQREFSTLK